MVCKGGSRLSVGWWGRNIERRIINEQIPEKIKTLLSDKILSLGKNVYLWKEITSTDQNISCSCTKNTTERSDITCSSCYGVGLIPGYIRLFHETIYAPSVLSSAILTNTILDKDIKPHRILLNTNMLSGTYESGPLAYSNLLNLDWEYRIDSANIKNTNSIDIEFSTDNLIFYPISELNDAGKKPINTGNIYIKITLNRANANDRSPEFEIFRLRHANKVDPYIKILRPQISESPGWTPYGRRTENLGERFWTMPLDFFDSNITKDTPAAKIVENSFYERVTGINVGIKFVTVKLHYNEEFGIFTEQSFETRRTQPNEFYNALVF